MDGITVGEAAARSGWSPRMLRYLERTGLAVPQRTASGYRLYRLGDVNRLSALRALRARFAVQLSDLAFAARLRREPALRAAVESWFADDPAAWVDWEQRKHERLLAA
jgi:MerR family transcriptional regulator, copper efflux regulator